MHVTVSFDSTIHDLLLRLVVAAEKIAVNTAPSPYAVTLQILKGQENTDMQKGKIVVLGTKRGAVSKFAAAGPTQVSDSSPQAIAAFGVDASGVYGGSLASGASVS